MSTTQREGLAVLIGTSGVGLLPGFSTPDGVLEHAQEIAATFEALERDMRSASGRFSKAELAAYEDLKDQWRSFYPAQFDWWTRFTGTGELSDRCDAFSRKVQYYRDQLKAKGAPVTGPPPEKPAPPLLEQLGTASGASSGYLKAGVVIAGIFAVGYGVKQIRSVLP